MYRFRGTSIEGTAHKDQVGNMHGRRLVNLQITQNLDEVATEWGGTLIPDGSPKGPFTSLILADELTREWC